MNTTFTSLLALGAAAVIVINGISVPISTILDTTTSVVNSANTHQLKTALEIYYNDYQAYPDVSGGEALVSVLLEKGFIETAPSNPSVFQYEVLSGGQKYSLKLADTTPKG